MKVYSADLRKKVLNAYRSGQGSMRKLSERFTVSLTFVFRLIKGFRQNGHISPEPYGGGRPAAISEDGRGFLIGLMKEKTDLTLRELCECYTEKFHEKVSRSATDRTLKKMDVSRKKNSGRPGRIQ